MSRLTEVVVEAKSKTIWRDAGFDEFLNLQRTSPIPSSGIHLYPLTSSQRMPLDSHGYLLAQGWSGKGTGLRRGAISRPLAIPQKRTLAGVGKDRDEAFPFWDHLFSAASKSIQIKVLDSEDGSDVDRDNIEKEDTNPVHTIARTKTGILSNRRPTHGVLASTNTSGTPSGASTPEAPPVLDQPGPRYNLLTVAKREAAKRNLYSKFFRGPVLAPDSEDMVLDMTNDDSDEEEGNGEGEAPILATTTSATTLTAMSITKGLRNQIVNATMTTTATTLAILSVEDVITSHLPGYKVMKRKRSEGITTTGGECLEGHKEKKEKKRRRKGEEKAEKKVRKKEEKRLEKEKMKEEWGRAMATAKRLEPTISVTAEEANSSFVDVQHDEKLAVLIPGDPSPVIPKRNEKKKKGEKRIPRILIKSADLPENQ